MWFIAGNSFSFGGFFSFFSFIFFRVVLFSLFSFQGIIVLPHYTEVNRFKEYFKK